MIFSTNNIEKISYIFFGIITTFINITIFFLCLKILNLNYMLSNLLAFIISVFFSFISNRIWVFKSVGSCINQFIKFFLMRVFSGVIDMILILIFLEYLNQDELFSKILVNLTIILINYIFSKYLIFNKGETI